MGAFKSLPKSHLRSGAHFTVMEAFQAKLKAAKFTPAKLTQLITKFDEALAEEDKCLKKATSSTYTPILAQVDEERDKVYMMVKQIIVQWASSALDPQSTAAKTLLAVVNLYNIDVRAQFDQETGLMTNFITDITTTENAAHVETLGLTSAVAKLKELNDQLKTLMASRSDESSQKATAALKAARKQVDAVYDELTAIIEAYSLTADDTTVYDTFISEWNAEVNRVRKQIGVKASASSTSTNGSASSGDGSSSSSDGGSSSSGDGSGSSSSGSDSGSSSSGSDSGSSSSGGEGDAM